MPIIQTCYSPALYPLFEEPETIVVVVDIFRATSAICTALDNGVAKMIPVAGLEEARKYKEMGYMVILDDYCTIVDRETDVTVIQTASINGIYVIYLNQLIQLQELKLEQNLKMNAAIEEEDELKLLHKRTGHVNCSTLVEACRCKLVEGVNLPRK
jgi:hypothetical protein